MSEEAEIDHDNMALVKLLVRYGDQVRLIVFCLPKKLEVGGEERYPVRELWERLEPGGGATPDVDALLPLDERGELFSVSRWVNGKRAYRYVPFRVRFDCRHLLQAEVH